MKCTINENNEITNFWNDEDAPENAIDCDKKGKILGEGNPPDEITYFYKLENGKAILTTAGIEYDANQYQRDRQYPSIGDQLDMQYHDQIDGTTTWKDAIAKVKADNPKE